MNKKEAIKLFETQPWTFKDLSAELKKDKDVVIAAIKQSFYILEHVDPLPFFKLFMTLMIYHQAFMKA